jgi:hypothetical protein
MQDMGRTGLGVGIVNLDAVIAVLAVRVMAARKIGTAIFQRAKPGQYMS